MRVAERHLSREHGGVVRLGDGRGRDVLEMHLVLPQPVAVRVLGGQLRLDLVVLDDATLRGVDEEDLARVQPLLDEDLFGRDVQHADLGGHHDEIVLGDVVT